MSGAPQPHATIACTNLLADEECAHSGWLRKRSKLHDTFKLSVKLVPWFNKYVVLCKGCMYMYSNETAKKPDGCFSFYGFHKIVRAGEILPTDVPWAFKLDNMTPESKCYYFCAASEMEMKTWMRKIKDQIQISNLGIQDHLAKCKGLSTGYYPRRQMSHNSDAMSQLSFGSLEESIYDTADLEEVKSYMEGVPDISRGRVSSKDSQGTCQTVATSKADSPSDSDDSDDYDQLDETGMNRSPFKSPTTQRQVETVREDAEPYIYLDEGEMHGNASKNRSRELPPTPTEPKYKKWPFAKSKPPKNDNVSLAAVKRPTPLPKPKPLIPTDISTTANTGPKIPGRHIIRPPMLPPPRPPANISPGASSNDASENATFLSLSCKSEDRFWQSVYWDGDKEEANRKINQLGEEGVFLVRSSDEPNVESVLVVYAEGAARKYKIYRNQDNKYHLTKGVVFETTTALIEHYFANDIPLRNSRLLKAYNQ